MTQQIKNFIRACLFSLASLTGAIALTVILSPWIYRIFNYFFKLHENVGLTSEQLNQNYQAIINYLIHPLLRQFHLPDFASSVGGVQHFAEVKFLIQLTLMATFLLFFLVVFDVFRIRKQRRRVFYFKPYLFLCYLLPLGVMFLAVVAFDKVFILFHQLFFRNELWLFDPLKDPIINVLPDTYFFVLLLVVIISYELLLGIIHLFIKKKI
ncbi:TIGR01906 family membrane protein [Facklamia miroungae]|uniref:Integral membrane protein TIGR01906 n=1 Tax=Facklamia miroungae TaxID=120956 RepID=A0A1G7U614_9LACT|nr:TIGR01906 family membrane protein [Facklamia miroungae]NKZ29929.1 TIGR01906 family membrane protein [Facklamia miroungae]SDG43006.1 integral membrane protein TIGR01906 [Facklamia miroungae]